MGLAKNAERYGKEYCKAVKLPPFSPLLIGAYLESVFSPTLSFTAVGNFYIPENISWSLKGTGNRGSIIADFLELE